MLSLDSTEWSELKHAYGFASDVPDLLRQLETLPSSKGNSEPWFSIWSALAHQGDVYPASFAAVPHVVSFLSKSPLKAEFSYFQFPALIEICRVKNSVPVPEELEEVYFSALSLLPELVAAASDRKWVDSFLACALLAIAASKGFVNIAEAVLEIDTEVADDFMEWFFNR